MPNYLNRKTTEVSNMLWGEYNYDEDIAAQRQEAFDDGISQGIQQGISQGIQQGISQGSQKAKIETAKNAIAMHLQTEEIVKLTGLSVDVIQSLQNN